MLRFNCLLLHHCGRHPFSRLEQGKERQEEPRGRAGGDHDPGGIEVEAVRLGIMAGDARA